MTWPGAGAHYETSSIRRVIDNGTPITVPGRELNHHLLAALSRVDVSVNKPPWRQILRCAGNLDALLLKFTPGACFAAAGMEDLDLAHNGTSYARAMVYGVATHEEHPGPDVLLHDACAAYQVEAPTRTPALEQLQEQIVEGLLAWHRQDSGGCVGMVDNTPGKTHGRTGTASVRYCGHPGTYQVTVLHHADSAFVPLPSALELSAITMIRAGAWQLPHRSMLKIRSDQLPAMWGRDDAAGATRV